MAPSTIFYLLLSVLAAGVAEAKGSRGMGFHLANRGLLQAHTSIVGRGVEMFPAHGIGHDADDDEHLAPAWHHVLHYAQWGHRMPRHGAKHATFKANFTRPTIVLDHTNQINSIQCNEGKIKVCFNSEGLGFSKAQSTWTLKRFNLATYHIGCGDETSGLRSYFLAENADFEPDSGCVRVSATPLAYEDAIESGEIEWGTYREKGNNEPVKGHLAVNKPSRRSSIIAKPPPPPPLNRRTPAPVVYRKSPVKLPRRGAGMMHYPVMPRQTNATTTEASPFGPDFFDDYEDTAARDITDDLNALIDFFTFSDFDTSDIDDLIAYFEDLDFIEVDGTVWTEEEEKAGKLDKRRQDQHLVRQARDLLNRRIAEKRGIQRRGWGFFEGIYNAAKKLVEKVKSWVTTALDVVVGVAKAIVGVAITAAKVMAVPFGVPFDESYKNDFTFNYTATGSATNRPPQIFGHTQGFNLAGTGGIYSIQCAKCGVSGEFSFEGRLAFSIQDGITQGHIALINSQTFNLDAIFGITLEVQYDKPIEDFNEQIAAVPLSPLSIPGIITLGPQLSLSGALDIIVNGQAELLIGGSLKIAPGEARLSLVKREDNKFTGFQTTFDPVARFQGTLTVSAEVGLPVSIEVGLDVLNGKFKKTVGLTNKPSVYAAAALNLNLPVVCKGITLSMGVKNRIYVSAIGMWDYDIRTDILYERALGCVGSTGFNVAQTLPDPTVTTRVPLEVGGDIANIKPNISDVAKKLSHNTTNNMGFKMIMDEAKSSILVSGKDGFIYLADAASGYDVSSPWGSVDFASGTVNFDVFGRILAWTMDKHSHLAAQIKVFDPDKVPGNFRAGALTPLKTEDGKTRYVVALTGKGSKDGKEVTTTFFPTFCKTHEGYRLYGSYYIIDKDGKIGASDNSARALVESFSDFWITDPAGEWKCRTVQLISG